MKDTNALILVGAAATPLVASQLTSGTFTGARDWRLATFGVGAASGAYYMLTKKPEAGALALGAGLAWLTMLTGSGRFP